MPGACYELHHILGEGGMGAVRAAVHQPSGRALAIKIPHLAEDRSLARRLLLREATAAARLRHPNIVGLIDVVPLDDGRVALVMERVEGENLGSWAESWPGWTPALRVLDDVLAALAAAHGAGIVHRDLKLENVLVDGSGRAKIADFGVAVDLDPRSAELESAVVAGTPLYMAPEQFSLDGHVGPWTDLYAFGSMLHVLLTGEAPFRAATVPELVMKKRSSALSGALEQARIPAPLAALVRALLEHDPRRRPRFAQDVRRALREIDARDLAVTRPGDVSHVRSKRITTPSLIALAATTPSTLPTLRAESGALPLGEDTLPSDPMHPAPRALTELPAPIDPDLGVAVARLRDPDLVGRHRERALIRKTMLDVAQTRAARWLGLHGASGVGKSALAQFGLAIAESEALMEPLVAAYDASGAAASGGLRRALARLLGTPNAHAAREAWKWLEIDGQLSFDADRMTRWLHGEVELRGRANGADLAFSALEAAARVRPIYLWLDDLGWAEDGALELVDRLLTRSDVAVCMLATLRSGTLEHGRVREAMDRILASPQAELVELPKLAVDERAELVRAVAPLEPGLARELAGALDETTLVVIELVRDWISAGLLAQSSLGYVATAPVRELLAKRPPSVALKHRVSLALAGFGSTADVAERVLVRAALIGTAFDELALAAACASFDPDGIAVHDVLDRSLLSGLLRPEGQDDYRFEHDAFRQALEARLDHDAGRASVLIDTGRGLGRRFGSARPELVARAAALLHQVDPESPEAWNLLLGAASTLARGSAFDAAERNVEIAEAWLEAARVPELDWRSARTVFTRGHLAFFRMRYDDAERFFARAARVAHGIGAVSLEQRCNSMQAQLLYYQDRLEEAERVAKAGIRQADDTPVGDADANWAVAICHHVLADLAAARGQMDSAIDYNERAVVLLRRISDPSRARVMRVNLAERLAVAGRVGDAERLLETLEAEVAAQHDTGSGPEVHEARMRLFAITGKWEALRDSGLAERVEEVASQGDAWRLTALRLFEALVAAHLEARESAERAAQAFIRAFRAASHDDPHTHRGMQTLADRLRKLGLAGQADGVLELLSERQAAIARALKA